jgi:putative permease
MGDPPRSLRSLASDPQIVVLAAVLAAGVALLYGIGFQLIPFIAAFVLAYFLDAGVQQLTRRGLGRGLAVGIVFAAYLVVYVALLVGPLQLVAVRAVEAAAELPSQTGELLARIQALPDPTFGLLPEAVRQELLTFLLGRTQSWFGDALRGSIELLPRVTSWVVFLFLVPLLVFFFLKDKALLIRGFVRCLPRRRELVTRIWLEMETQLGNYVRGKIWEILIVGVVTWLVFALLGFNYPVVFGVLSGLSVVVPYVGAIGLAVPVFVQGLAQWGLGWELGWLMIAYTVIQFVDGNVLTPYIFSEAVKLHPVVILLAVFVFGGVWGFWGVLFAIPLATFAKALLNALLDFRERAAEPPG